MINALKGGCPSSVLCRWVDWLRESNRFSCGDRPPQFCYSSRLNQSHSCAPFFCLITIFSFMYLSNSSNYHLSSHSSINGNDTMISLQYALLFPKPEKLLIINYNYYYGTDLDSHLCRLKASISPTQLTILPSLTRQSIPRIQSPFLSFHFNVNTDSIWTGRRWLFHSTWTARSNRAVPLSPLVTQTLLSFMQDKRKRVFLLLLHFTSSMLMLSLSLYLKLTFWVYY